jgi:hypothetical protein
MKQLLDVIVDKIAATDSRVDKLFEYFSEQGHAHPDQKSSAIPTTIATSELRKSLRSTSRSETEHTTEGALLKEKTEVLSLDRYTQSLKQEDLSQVPMETEINADEEGELSIPIEHTTAAHKLLSWPSINRLLDCGVNEDYVLTNERQRGLIRIYGCGEGHDHDSKYYYQRDRALPPIHADSPATTTSSASPRFEEENVQAGSPNWGYGLPVTPNGGRPGERPGGLDQNGYLNTSPDVVRRLHRSFMTHIHTLHPFLEAGTLEKKVALFIRQYGRRNMTNPGEARGMKRKRSAEGMHSSNIGPHDMSRSPSINSEKPMPYRIERSIDNAIILMMLALGAICEHKGPIPGFAQDPSEKSRRGEAFAVSPEAQAVFNDILSPSPASAPASAGVTGQAFQSPSVPSPDPAFDWKTPTPRPVSKFGHDSYPDDFHPRNVDVIPGLAYYAYAAGILGDLQGGIELPYVQAAILASLYAGQLAHPFQSHGWIFQAARACQFIVRA